MTLKQIEYFQIVRAKGNISSAATDMFVSRSVVSRAIAELEEEFKTTIFTRSKNGVELTESGKILARLFDEFMSCYSTTKERVRHIEETTEVRVLRLGVTPTNAYCLYRAYYDSFRASHPDIRLKVIEHGANDARALLLDGTIDASFTPAKISLNEGFEVLELYQNPIMLGVAEGHPLSEKRTASIADILDLPLGFFNAPMPLESILNTCFQALGKIPNVVLRTSDQVLLKELTVRGILYPILPLDMMATWEGVRQVNLDFFHPSHNRLVWSRALSYGAAMESFLIFMRAQVRQ